MLVKINKLLCIEDILFVDFLSPAGSGNAVWVGVSPTAGDELDVEFDLDQVFSWGRNITPSSRTRPLITVINGVIHITAEIIQKVDEDWVVLKLEDSIILLGLEEPIIQKSGFVEVTTNKIHLYPTNI